MSLNKIQLPDNTIVDLYKNLLIEPGTIEIRNKSEELNSKKESIAFLGNNKKQVVVIVNYADSMHLPDTQLNFLTSILTACKLSLDDIAIVNMSNIDSINFKNLFKQIPAQSVLLFDVATESLSLPLNFPNFQVQFFDNINYLTSPSLDIIEKDKALKTQLWNSLKKLFKL
jgi:hypothetical protein